MESITCPRCGMTSYNPNDVLNKYCGACCRFHENVGRPVRRISLNDEWYDTLSTEEVEAIQLRAREAMREAGDDPKTRAIVGCDVMISLCGEVLGFRAANRVGSSEGEVADTCPG